MQCRYKEKIMICGDYVYGDVHATWRPAGKRQGKFRETSEEMQRYNDWKSEIRLVTVVHTNFVRGDYALHLTYSEEELPERPEDFEKDVRNFVAKVRRLYAREQAELKYVIVRGWSGKGRPHVHMILTGGVSRERIEELWGHGLANCDRLEFTETGITDLAVYISRQRDAEKTDGDHIRRKGERRWSGSRNLKKPEERTNLTRYSKAAMEEIADSPNPHKIFADRYPGYWLAEMPEIRQNPVTHAWGMTFVLYKPDSPNLAVYARRERPRKSREVRRI